MYVCICYEFLKFTEVESSLKFLILKKTTKIENSITVLYSLLLRSQSARWPLKTLPSLERTWGERNFICLNFFRFVTFSLSKAGAALLQVLKWTPNKRFVILPKHIKHGRSIF